MTKDDLINALKVMRHILFTAKLAHEPADKMIAWLESNTLYTEKDIEEAFLSGYLVNTDFWELKEGQINELFANFKSSAFIDRFGNKPENIFKNKEI